MEVKIVEESKNRLVFDILGDTNTLTGALKNELWKNENVKATGYNIEHPLINIPRFVVETTGEDPRKVIKNAIKNLQKEIKKLQEQTKEIKG